MKVAHGHSPGVDGSASTSPSARERAEDAAGEDRRELAAIDPHPRPPWALRRRASTAGTTASTAPAREAGDRRPDARRPREQHERAGGEPDAGQRAEARKPADERVGLDLAVAGQGERALGQRARRQQPDAPQRRRRRRRRPGRARPRRRRPARRARRRARPGGGPPAARARRRRARPLRPSARLSSALSATAAATASAASASASRAPRAAMRAGMPSPPRARTRGGASRPTRPWWRRARPAARASPRGAASTGA